MSTKQRLLFITTGGTIASVRTQQGLKPVLTSEELLAHLPELNELCCPDTLALCSIDSTDLGPEHWLMMAKAVQENYALYDGFIICHGTDTLAYSAAALSYLIQNADKPVILTGAQQPISNEITDAKKNLRDSVICALDSGSRGVMVVFGGHVIAGTRAKKNKTISYDAFASVNFPALALVQGDRLVRYVPSPWPTGPVEFGRSLSPRVFLLKLTPGLSPDLIPDIFRLYDCVIVESFGVGGIPQRLMDAFAGHELHFITGHTHVNSNYDIREGVVEHNVAQICGNLWYDPINKDGTPKGYQLFRECGGEFSWEYRSLGSPAVRQLRVWQPGQVEAFPGSVVAKIWNWDPCWTVVWYEDGRYRGAMQRIQIVDPDYAAHLDSLKNAGRKLAKSQHPRISDFYFKARPSASAQTIEVVATDRFGRRYSERITLEKAQ